MNWKIALVYILPQHLFSRFSGWLSRRKIRWFKLFSIRWFIRTYQVNVQEAAITDLDAYPTFNDFFIRHLRADARPLPQNEQIIVSPVDANISEFGKISAGKLIQAKGHEYTLSEFIVQPELITRFSQGQYCTLYLAPYHYHRVHIPMNAQLKQMIYIPGRLFSVNQQSVQQVERLFARNERVICEFNTAIGPMLVILVGACQVGNIHMKWHGQVAPNIHRDVQTWHYDQQAIHFKRGDEIGYFTLGSTVIVLFPENKIIWDEHLQTQKEILLGQPLARPMQ